MSSPTTIKTALQATITKANSTTGKNDTNVTDAVNSLIEGYGQGGGITPSGTLTITENGTFDVTNYANVFANVAGINARVYNVTIPSDQTTAYTLITNDWLKSIRANPNAFVIMRWVDTTASIAAVHLSFSTNFTLCHSGASAFKSAVIRSSASSYQINGDARDLSTENYNGHLTIRSDGKLISYGNTTYPLRAGQYQIVAGLIEEL
jgi:hypothetical protein